MAMTSKRKRNEQRVIDLIDNAAVVTSSTS